MKKWLLLPLVFLTFAPSAFAANTCSYAPFTPVWGSASYRPGQMDSAGNFLSSFGSYEVKILQAYPDVSTSTPCSAGSGGPTGFVGGYLGGSPNVACHGPTLASTTVTILVDGSGSYEVWQGIVGANNWTDVGAAGLICNLVGQSFRVISPNTNDEPGTSTTTSSTSVDFKAQYFYSASSTDALSYSPTGSVFRLTLFNPITGSTTIAETPATGPLDTLNTLDIPLTLEASTTWSYVWTRTDPGDFFRISYGEQPNSDYFVSVLEQAALVPGLIYNVGGLATSTCSIGNITGCFQNALVFLFYPAPDVLNGFRDTWQLVQHKPPFGYVSATIAAVQGLNDSGTPAFTFPDLPFVSSIFTPIRTALGFIVWLLFAIAFYNRLKHLDI